MVWLVNGILERKTLNDTVLVVRRFRMEHGVLIQKTILDHVRVLDIKHHWLEKDIVFSKIFPRTQFVNLVYVLILLILLVILLSWCGFESTILMQVFWRPRLNLYLPLIHLFNLFISYWDEPVTLNPWWEVELTGLHAPLLAWWLLATLHIKYKWVLNSVKSLELVLSFGCGLVSHINWGLLRNWQ